MEQAGSSRVTVRYHDPAGVFPLISKQLASRLPLRNLNWQSPSRPLRRIKSLHVEFVPLSTSTGSPPGSITTEPEKHDEVGPFRRHQIPGLKTSPYLNLYLLRCDDKEQYKEKAKAELRGWVKEVTEAKQRDDHDAFEWLILHVVLPNTPAASEPRWREAPSKEAEELRERPKSSSKWPTKGSRTVFDRLRSDFNESKVAPDRVAQIRLTKNDVGVDLLPPAAMTAPQAWEESVTERENAWYDLVTKFKALILGPFDARVRQYEADINVQESRRCLPGWNFCTFFVHKEGLARALEVIGLVEDALAIYDELSLDLETVVHDIASGAAEKTATSFAEVTYDIRKRLLTGTSVELSDAEYRRKIVTSNISVFDFFSYIFARQTSLLARLANVVSAGSGLDVGKGDGGEDLVLLGEMCWRTSNFIHNISRLLRQDLHRQSEQDVEGLVQSWACDVANSVLIKTNVPIFEKLTSHRDDAGTRSVPFLEEQVPQRASSLATRPRRPDAGGQLEHAIPGQAELATYRADLIMVKRRAIESAARRNDWSIGRNEPTGRAVGDTRLSPLLANILREEAEFRLEMERLSLQAIRHYSLATQFRVVLAIQADLAMLYWHQDEPEKALECLQKVVLADSEISTREDVFKLYIKCLQRLGRTKEYTDAVLVFASRACHAKSESSCGSRMLTELIKTGEIEHDTRRPMHEFFADIEVQPEIKHREDGHGFSMWLSFRSLLTESLPISRISVSLVAVDDAQEEIVLSNEDSSTVIEPGYADVVIGADVVCTGAFYIEQVRLDAGRLRLFHDFVPPPEIPTLIIGDARPHAGSDKDDHRRPWVLIYPSERDFDVEIDLSQDIDVSRRRSLELRLLGGGTDITKIDLKLRPQAAGLRLHIADAEVEGIVANSLSQLSLGCLKAGEKAKLRIPYTLENPSIGDHMAIRCEALCKTISGSSRFIATARLPAELPLVIDVEDSFQVDALISNYSVSTATNAPVIVESARLKESVAYGIEAPSSSPLPTVILHREHPTRLVYKVTRKALDMPTSVPETRLALQIIYRRVEDVIRHCVSQQLEADLMSTPFHHLKRLLLPHLAARLRNANGTLELTRAALMEQCKVPGFAAMEWSNIITDSGLLGWLAQWHAAHSHVGFGHGRVPERRMTIAVDVPKPDFVHSVRVMRKSSSEALQLGQRVDAIVEIHSTTNWGTGAKAETDFVVDVHAEPNTWLVGGLKRGRFTAGGTPSPQRMEMSLVPLRVGVHTLPTIDIQPVSGMSVSVDGDTDATRETTGGGGGGGERPVTSMTHCASAGETVHVVRESQQTRIHVAGVTTTTTTAAVPLRA